MHKREEAVSPVIGVILMVAITVILAAVIAAFVFGMAGNVQKTKSVAVTASKGDNSIITLTNMGGKDTASLSQLIINGSWSNGTKIDKTILSATDATVIGVTTGSSQVIPGTSGKDHVIVTGSFTDGQSQVLLDTSL
jgi:archaeal type IV pilus assembly protein PilA